MNARWSHPRPIKSLLQGVQSHLLLLDRSSLERHCRFHHYGTSSTGVSPHRGGPNMSAPSATRRLLASRSSSSFLVPLLVPKTSPSCFVAIFALVFCIACSLRAFCSATRSTLSGSRHFLSFLFKGFIVSLLSPCRSISIADLHTWELKRVESYCIPVRCSPLGRLLFQHGSATLYYPQDLVFGTLALACKGVTE